MWVFYLISLPLTLGMVILTLKYFSGPDVPRYVFFTVGYTWFCSISIIILVPADIWTTIIGHGNGGISFFWSWSYWSTFLLTWLVVPLIQGYEDAGDFTMIERLKTSIHVNLVFYLIVGSIGLLGLILLITMDKDRFGSRGILGWAMACSNTFGLVTGAFLLGFGLSEIPKNIWKNADWTNRHKVLSHKIAKIALKLDDAHQELSNAIVVAQATSKQMSKRDPLRPYMDVIDNMLVHMFKVDPSFKPQGGRLGENDMDYDTDEKSMATLRRHLRGAREEYYRCKSEYLTYVTEAIELEDTIKNYERRSMTGWKYISSFRPERSGTLGSFLDMAELVWRCILQKQLEKIFAVILGCMSVAILLAEATLLTNGVDLSLFSILVKSVGNEEVLVQIFAFVPLMFMCVCTYYSLFKVGRLMFYSLTPRQTSAVSLLMICSMVARYAPPISYNFLNLISLGKGKETIFEQGMGNIDKAVPFFWDGFNSIYPLIMVIYTILVASNFFDRVISFFGNWKFFRFQTDTDDMDGFDPSGLLILQKERTWLEQGRKVGEHVIPLARIFNGVNLDLESGINNNDKPVEMKIKSDLRKEDIKGSSSSKPSSKDETQRYSGSKEAISSKYAAIREQSKSSSKPTESISSAKVSLLDSSNPQSSNNSPAAGPSGLASKWAASMKQGFQNFKANVEAKKFLPLRQVEDTKMLSRVSSSESLDEIFQRLKRPSVEEHVPSSDDDEDGHEIKVSSRSR
ncbi:PREDICTED: LOW QUALITY PROTEIN: LMBR1 domain-containing protein 2 homolog A-like [Erythranthe guttata]|uniref:LOW QUALITY PROTEIN: LMBR1 domain-containing protein 2 homolog A-like n=1 Tax=Erythranthe guttata TaxID=4155 RepID=UPI00064DFB03|nr:PREDICTED: LOW QUALITY PROTEIN: LMBR1 domain-containing protein 2 homolog A-like [Erythranthe guttata]|eukprot:XP_012840823.1 PREDICTED: LOW QUALITY PROTEIN: LMBR1 domain-containing protein 2 homolog A-like [Erythranthe guttata]